MAQRTFLSANGPFDFCVFRTSSETALPYTASTLSPWDLIDCTWFGGTESITSTAPDCSCSTRALSSPTTLKTSLSSVGLPFCQYFGLRTRSSSLPLFQFSSMNAPVPSGCVPSPFPYLSNCAFE